MTAATASLRQVPEPPGFTDLLSDAQAAVTGLAGAAEGLDELPGDDVLAVMGQLTTLTARIDALRVATAAAVRDRDLPRRAGARNLTGWLKADPRTADDAWKIAQLAASTSRLPRILTLLRTGQISLAQAGTACWQVTRLPDIPAPPPEAPDPAANDPGPDPAGTAADDRAGPDPAADPDAPAGPDDPGTGSDPARHGEDTDNDPADPDGQPGWQRDPDEAWAGMWQAGDLHAAADQLFARYLPSLDARQIRALGAHLREAADAQERAGEEYDDYAARALRITTTLGSTAQITGHLHPEAAAQVLAAFDELGGKYGPDDTRTKAQRWADVLTGLTAGAHPAHPAHSASPASDTSPADPDTGTSAPRQPGASEDDQPGPDGEHLHGHPHLTPADHPMAPAGLRRPRLLVTIPITALLGHPLSPGAILGAGTPISAQAARRVGCDAEIIRIITAPGTTAPPGQIPGPRPGATGQLTRLLAQAITALPRPLGGPSAILDAGRKHPGWTPRQRDALHAHYGGHCSAPRCNGPIDVIHHVIHWTQGGLTSVSNGAPVCNYHHWLVHEGGWRMKKHPDGTIVLFPPPPRWQPGTIYRHGKPTRAG